MDWLRGFIEGRTGVQLRSDAVEMVQSRLGPVRRSRGYPDIPALVAALQGGEVGLAPAVLDALTTHETSFFRDPAVFEWLRREILPALLQECPGDRPLRVWSAASSTGQESLSVAMLLREGWPGRKHEILATDVSDAAIGRAVVGLYSLLEVNRGLPALCLVRWFDRDGMDYRARPELLAGIRWRTHNLLTDPPPQESFDLILLRNVLIYFNGPTRQAIVEHIAAAARPGAVVVLGTAEAATPQADELFSHQRSAGVGFWRRR